MKAKIYQPAKTAMQSGTAQSALWLLEFIPEKSGFVEPLMGWSGARETTGQIRLKFNNLSEAVEYASAHNIPYEMHHPKGRSVKPKAYADNFSFKRIRTYEGKNSA